MRSSDEVAAMIARTRRALLKAGAAAPLLALVRPAAATPEEASAAISSFTGGANLQTGRVTFVISRLIDNGNAVPVTVRVQSPMTSEDHVTSIAIFNQRNPLPDVARFTLTPRSGKAEVSTRIRLATSQQLVAVAGMSDGTFWQQTVDVIVTLAACIEGEVS
jgi:sulfur-oxidizing protein SoxY